jgi:flagellin
MQEIQDMLNRMDYLATQSANGTYDNEVDRANLDKEVKALKSEINRIADSANFNGIKLLDGTWAKEVTDGGAVDTGDYDMSGLTMNKLAASLGNIKDNESVDGAKATDATHAKISIRLKKDVTIDLDKLKNVTVSVNGKSVSLSDMFDITLSDGSDVVDGEKTEASTKIVLTAKNAGKFDSTTIGNIKTKLSAVTFAAASNVSGATANATGSHVTLTANIMTTGSNVGEGGAGDSVNAVYTVKVDLSKLDGGTKLQISGLNIEFTNDSITSAINQVSGVGLDAGGNAKISIVDLDLSKSEDQEKLIERIEAALGDHTDGMTNDTSGKLKDFEFDVGKKTGSTYSFTITAKEGVKDVAGTGGNRGQVKVVSDSKNGISVTEQSGVDGDNANPAGNHATASFKWNVNSMKAGDVISIGGKTIEIIDSSDPNAKEDINNGKLFLDSLKDKDKLNKTLQALGYDAGNVKAVDENFITIEKKVQDDTTAADWAKGDGKVEVGTPKPEPEEPEEPEEVKGGETLTLQIGDTADKFNQLGVNIGDMHTKAMGTGKATIDGKEVEITETIDDIDISTQEGAQKAIYSIRNAINTVSSVRGDLGAVQNRLDHTANNLSVMAENIQDAESTIRDTDVANEMMSYVKNNILVQSAQAMLAQANQVPQGVLQLLG